jgi:hypothetical protein
VFLVVAPTKNKMGVYLVEEKRRKHQAKERRYGDTMTVTTVAEFRMQFMAVEKAKAGQLDFGGNNPIWSGAFRLLENAQKWRVR